MSDPKEAAVEVARAAADAAISETTSVGRQLQAARLARKLTLEDAAQHLKYSVKQIEALEYDDFAALPAAAVVRGMIRSYAKFLNLDADELLTTLRTRLAEPAPSVPLEGMSVPFPKRRGSSHRAWWILSGLVALIGAVVLLDWTLGARERIAAALKAPATGAGTPPIAAGAAPVAAEPSRAEATLEATPAPSTPGQTQARTGQPSSPLSPAATLPGGVAAPVLGAAVAAPTQAAPAVPAEAVRGAPGTKRVVIAFATESWVEVRGADGQIVSSKIHPAGSQVIIDERPPVRLVIGAAGGVRLSFDGKPFDLAPFTQVDVARVTLQ